MKRYLMLAVAVTAAVSGPARAERPADAGTCELVATPVAPPVCASAGGSATAPDVTAAYHVGGGCTFTHVLSTTRDVQLTTWAVASPTSKAPTANDTVQITCRVLLDGNPTPYRISSSSSGHRTGVTGTVTVPNDAVGVVGVCYTALATWNSGQNAIDSNC